MRKAEIEFQREMKEKEQDFELKKIEHEIKMTEEQGSRIGIQPTVINAQPVFRVDIASNLLPKLTDSNVVEFFDAFQKIQELNNWQPQYLTQILYPHLSGRSLSAFSQLSLEEAKSFETVNESIPFNPPSSGLHEAIQHLGRCF